MGTGGSKDLWLSVRKARLAVFMVAAVGLAGCQDRHEWHQKLTVVVSTPSGKVSGSSVAAINARFGQVPLSDIEVWYRVTGEATVVEVAPGRYLFALLEGTEERLYRSIRKQSEYRSRGDWLKIIPTLKDTVKLSKKRYPDLVAFLDIDNPKSVREVNPSNIDKIFGDGFRLQKITIEITKEPVTQGPVQDLLAWWFEQAEVGRDPPAFRVPNASPRGYTTVGVRDFIRGINWRQK